MDLIDSQTNPAIATYAKTGEVHIRITARVSSEEEVTLDKPAVKEIGRKGLAVPFTAQKKSENFERAVVRLLKKYESRL